MPTYIYKAINNYGERLEDRIDKHSEAEVLEFLKAAGYFAIEVRRAGALNAEIKVFGKKIGKKDIAVFCRQLSFTLNAGLTLPDSFSILAGQAKHAGLRRILSEINDTLQKGGSLSECMARYKEFPSIMPGMAQIGEGSGKLPYVMEKMADYYEREAKLNDEMKGAMYYPAIVSVLMLAVMIITVVFVVPSYADVFSASGIPLPAPTRILIAASGFLSRNFIAIAAVLASIAAVFYIYFKSDRGGAFLDAFKLNAPIAGSVYRMLICYRFSQSMSVMLSSGQQTVQSLETVKAVIDNRVIADEIDMIVARVQEGANLWQLLREPHFDALLSGMVRVGEETGELPRTMAKAAEFFQNESSAALQRLSKLLEPAITIILGIILAFIMLSVMLPTFALTNAM